MYVVYEIVFSIGYYLYNYVFSAYLICVLFKLHNHFIMKIVAHPSLIFFYFIFNLYIFLQFEHVIENEYLADFYKDPKQYSFPLQIYLLNHRFRQV